MGTGPIAYAQVPHTLQAQENFTFPVKRFILSWFYADKDSEGMYERSKNRFNYSRAEIFS